jgi:hypothetical protein
MKTLLTFVALLALVAVGCTTKSTARANQRAAFYQGQAQALSDQLASQKPQRAPGNTVAIVGPVKVSALAWTPDLTLAKTIFAAEYIAAGEPSQIFVTRNGAQFPVSPAQLLNGEDFPMQPGDVVELRP